MENCYMPNNPNYDLWRASPLVKQQDLRSSVDVGVNTTFPVSPIDLEPLSNIFSFASCPPSYKEFSVLKEKNPHDIADALLSLKHAVVHPQMNGQLPPLSPSLPPHLAQSMASPNTAAPTLSYTVGHHQGGQGYVNSGVGQYPPPPPSAQYSDNTAGHQGPPCQPQSNMFPSMSVNVSMSMNVGMPPHGHGGQTGSLGPQSDQWSAYQPCGPGAQYSPNQNIHMQTQYPTSYNCQNNTYSASYSFTPDFCRGVNNSKDMMYKSHDDYKSSMSKLYTLNSMKKGKPYPPHPCRGSPPEPGKLNLCRICGKTYARPSTLKTHMRTHSGEKPYRCNTCNKCFSQAANLTAHIRTHSGEKPFRCPICDRRFSQSSSVTTHMRTHSGERPYRCRMCKKAFSDSSTLTKHLRIHSGEKPYQCKLCLLRFSQSGNLNRHMRVHANQA